MFLLIPSALAVEIDLCADYDVSSLVDTEDADDDYFTHTGDRPARGAYLKVTDASGETLYAGYTAWDGDDAGCTGTMTLDEDDGPFDVKIYAKAQIDGNTVRVFNDDDAKAIWTSTKSIDPHDDGTVYVVTGSHKAWGVASTTGWALKRRNAGLSGEVFDVYTCGCPSTSGTCLDGASGSCARSGGNIYLSDNHSSRKYTVAHELGHSIAARRDGGSPSKSYNAALGDCPGTSGSSTSGHNWLSTEYQGAAAVEGFAHYYSAVIYNDVSESDCWIMPNKQIDWDQDGTRDGMVPLTCEGGGPVGDPFGIDPRDYFGDHCLVSSGTVEANRGTEYDWVRFFWDLDTDQGLSFNTIVDVWDTSNPRLWLPTGNSSGLLYPATQLRLAAGIHGVGSEWDAEVDHGAWR